MKTFYKGKLKIEDDYWDRFVLFKGAWNGCKSCPDLAGRKRVVLVRGSIPARVLFVGEAPGVSEDAIGLPFIGEAGHLLDKMIGDAFQKGGVHPGDVPVAFTNVVGCVPREDTDNPSSGKLREPTKEEVNTCKPRLEDLVELAHPKVVVAVGQVAQRFTKDLDPVPLIHPSAILRKPIHQQNLPYKRAVLTLAEVFRTVLQLHVIEGGPQ